MGKNVPYLLLRELLCETENLSAGLRGSAICLSLCGVVHFFYKGWIYRWRK